MRLLRDAALQFWMELRFGLRDPHMLGYVVWMPLFLYPALIFAVFQLIAVREGRAAAQRYTVAVTPAETLPTAADGAPSAREVLQRLRLDSRVTLVERADIPVQAAARASYLADNDMDGIVTFAADGDKLSIQLSHLGVRSTEALVRRFERVVARYRTSYERRVERLAPPPRRSVDVVNAASSRAMGEFILARLLPVTLIIFLGTGAFYTAIDVTAGERERGTFETTLLLPSSRLAIVLGKYGYVLLMAMTAALLNFVSLTLTLGHALTLLGEGLDIDIAIPPGAMVVVFAALALLGLAICPLMMGLSFLTKSFREGQSYVGPIYALLITPTAIASLPGIELTPKMALVPMVNVTLALREVIDGRPIGVPFVIALAETALLGVVFVYLAARLLGRDEARAGLTDSGSMLATLRSYLRMGPTR